MDFLENPPNFVGWLLGHGMISIQIFSDLLYSIFNLQLFAGYYHNDLRIIYTNGKKDILKYFPGNPGITSSMQRP